MRHVLVLTAVPASRLDRLNSVAPERVQMLAVAGWHEMIDTIRREPVEMAIVDPMLGGRPRTHEIERIRLLFPSLPVMLYTTLAPESAGILLALGRAVIRRAVFTRFDDAPGSLRAAVM